MTDNYGETIAKASPPKAGIFYRKRRLFVALRDRLAERL